MKKMPRTIPGIIKIINESNDMDTIETMENYIGCYYGVLILLIGAIVNFMLHHELKSSVLDSVFMLLLCSCFAITPYLKLKTRIITHWISILFSIVLIFVTVRIYDYMGPAIWTVAFLNIIISSIRTTRVMLNYVTVSILFVSIYYSLVLSRIPFEYGTEYYATQIFLIAFIVVITPFLHLINRTHYNRVNHMYMTEVKQRVELEKMYHDIAATHTELRLKYDELNEKNKELKRNEEKLYHMAHYDLITELPNRKTILDRIHKLIEESKTKAVYFYMVFIDIDSFKKINDTMGHHVGDLFIKQAADRFIKNIDKEDLIGRIGGDEFALVIQRNLSREEALFYLDRIRMEFIKPFIIGDNKINTSASFGVAAFPADGVNQSELLKNADAAMYKAKELGKNNIQFFTDSVEK